MVPEGHVLPLLKAVYGTVQAARRWHTKISTWMEDNNYRAVNSEKTIFMIRPKATPMQPGNVLTSADAPEVPEKHK